MRVCVVTPAPPGSLGGNRVTALRWARILRSLGHDVDVRTSYDGRQSCDLLVALHARRSADSIARLRDSGAEARVVLALTGTDVYGDLHDSTEAREALGRADALVVLQPEALRELPEELRQRARVIYQSARAPTPDLPEPPPRPADHRFVVCSIANLRPVKDPLLVAAAARLLPPESRLHVLHAGRALDPDLARRARQETVANPRYEWLGPLPRRRAATLLRTSRLMVLASRAEGGANVVSEAVVAGVAVLATRIPGSVGLLGADYPGYFEVGSAEGLARLMRRAEKEPAFLGALREHGRRLRRRFDPARERAAWRRLIRDLERVQPLRQ